MPRSARKESGCGIYHVMMRGINRQASIFNSMLFTKFSEGYSRFTVQGGKKRFNDNEN